MKKYLVLLCLILGFKEGIFATFNVISDGDPGLAAPIMQNFRHVNYGNVLKPVDTNGNATTNVLDIGSTTAKWRDLYMSGTANILGNLFINTNSFYVDAVNNKIGILTSSPAARFDLQGGAYAGNYISSRYNTSNAAIVFAARQLNGNPYLGFNTVQNSGADTQTYGVSSIPAASIYGGLSGTTALNFLVAPSGTAGNTISFTTAMSILGDGKVGIGTTDPSSYSGNLALVNSTAALLALSGGSSANQGALIRIQKGTTDKSYIGSASSVIGGGSTSDDLAIYDVANANILFGTNNSERMRLTSSGLLGIGTSSPSALIHAYYSTSSTSSVQDVCYVESTSTGTPDSTFGSKLIFSTKAPNTNQYKVASIAGVNSSSGSSDGNLVFYTLLTNSSTEKMRILQNGNVGIGTSSPAKKLDVSGTFQASGTANINNDLIVTGDIYTTAWTDYSGTSTVTGWSSYIAKKISYKKIGKLVFVQFNIFGTSNAVTSSFTLPFTSNADIPVWTAMEVEDNGSFKSAPGSVNLAISDTTVNLYLDFNAGAWTSSGQKCCRGQFWYQTN